MAFFLQLALVAFLLPLHPAKANSGAGSGLHPFYISVTEITQNQKTRSLEISCKFFADDFEQTLEQASKKHLDISSVSDKATFDSVIPDYIAKHLQLSVDGLPIKLNYVGYEKDKESAYCYFEVPNVPSVKRLEAINSLLHDFKPEQINIMHVVVDGKRLSTKLDYPANKATFRF